MKFGTISILMALIALGYSSWFYYKAYKSEKFLNRKDSGKTDSSIFFNHARFGFYVMAGWIATASVYLWYLIFTHQFQVDYIYRYTSSDLSTGYLFSAFWAGQEGSFLFWALMVAFMGILFIRYSRSLESAAMLTVNIIQAGFILLLIKASPFALSGANPVEGAGLNPLLQNPWMVIHPPVLFLGYAATTIPFAIAIAALINKDFSQWITAAIPWALFASITMGAGIIIGGYWAYKVLGWGGYWGWDPVENSSLVAWLVVLALFHGLLISRAKNGFQRTNFTLAILSFILVLYATFLTRSGVLADFSVHSFQDLGINGYLIFYLSMSLLAGFLLLYQRRNEIPYSNIFFEGLTKENILVLTVIILSASAAFILLGTSSPIITSMLGNPAQVDISFYNRVNLPIGILMSLALGIAPVLLWKNLEFRLILQKLSISISIAILTTIGAIVIGMTGVLNILFLASVMFALTSNVMVLIQKIKSGWRFIIAPLGHVGVAMMFAGISISAVFDKTERVVLTKDLSMEVLGYELTYTGRFNNPDGKNGIIIEVVDGNTKYLASPRIYNNSYTKSEMREPHVEENLFSDLYIAPLELKSMQNTKDANLLSIKKGETKSFAGYNIQFEGFDLKNHEQGQGNFRVAAILHLSNQEENLELKPAFLIKGREKINEPAIISSSSADHNNDMSIELNKINPEQKNIQLVFNGIDQSKSENLSDQIVLEVSRKPLMSVLWFGTVILTIATIMALIRRSLELKIAVES